MHSTASISAAPQFGTEYAYPSAMIDGETALGHLQMNYATLLKPEIDTDLVKDSDQLAQLLARHWQPDDQRGWTDDNDLMSQLLAYAAQAEQKIADQKQRIAYLETLSLTDELTGLCNRRGFELAIEKALSNAKRHGEKGIIGFFDLDGFKEVNDTYGHEAGDNVLKKVADTLKQNVRNDDCAARIGGDEFAVVLRQSKPLGGAKTLRRIQNCLEESLIEYQGLHISVGASLGMQTFCGNSKLRELLFGADRAMYQNKRLRKKAIA